MEWVIGLIVLIVIGMLSSDEKKSPKKKTKAKTVAVKDFIEAGKVYTVEEAKAEIRRFVEAQGDSKSYRWVESAEELSESLPRLLGRLKTQYVAELTEIEQSFEGERAHTDRQIQAVKSQPDLDEYDKNEDIAALLDSHTYEEKEYQRLRKWCEKQISSLEENPTPILKRVLALLKKEHREDNPPPDYAADHWDEFLKEPPY